MFNVLKWHCKRRLIGYNPNYITPGLVASFSTTPLRINRIWPTLNSLLQQTMLPEKILLWLPKYYQRFKTSIHNLPPFLVNHPLIEVNWIEKDYGPATKLLPALQALKGTNSSIIVFDDDRLYHPKVFEQLLTYARRFPEDAVTYIGSDVVDGKRIKYTRSKTLKQVDVLHGYGSYLVKPHFFNDDIFRHPNALDCAFFQDDVWISGCLKQSNTTITMLPHTFVEAHQNLFLQNWLGGQKALCRQENKTNENFLKTWAYFNEKDIKI